MLLHTTWRVCRTYLYATPYFSCIFYYFLALLRGVYFHVMSHPHNFYHHCTTKCIQAFGSNQPKFVPTIQPTPSTHPALLHFVACFVQFVPYAVHLRSTLAALILSYGRLIPAPHNINNNNKIIMAEMAVV